MTSPTDWIDLFQEHMQICATCRDGAPNLCNIGHIMCQFAGRRIHEDYLARLSAVEEVRL